MYLLIIQIWITDLTHSLILTLNRWFKFEPAEGSPAKQLKFIKLGPKNELPDQDLIVLHQVHQLHLEVQQDPSHLKYSNFRKKI